MTAKDPNYDRYAGIIEIEDPLKPQKTRPYRVDEDGLVIYRDEELDALRRLSEDEAVRVAELGNSTWNGYEAMRGQGQGQGQGQRDGRILKGVKDRLFPPENPDQPLPPASRTYSVPPGYKAWAFDPQHRLILDANGKPVRHPAYEQAFKGDMVDEAGVAMDLGKIAAGVAIPLRAGAMAAGGAAMMVGSSAAKEGYEVTKDRRTKKERQ